MDDSFIYEKLLEDDYIIKLYNENHDKLGRFSKTGASAAIGFAGGGPPGMVTSALISEFSKETDAKTAGLIGGGIGGGPVGVLGSYVTARSMENGGGMVSSMAKGILTNIAVSTVLVAGVAVGVGVISSSVINNQKLKEMNRMEVADDNTISLIFQIVKQYATMNKAPEYIAIEVGNKDIPGFKRSGNYIIVSQKDAQEYFNK